MADKFLGVGTGQLNFGNGTAQLFAASIGAANLDPSKPVRTNSVRQLVSTYLPISDIVGLQTRLNATLTNPYNGNLNVQDLTTGITPGVQVGLNTFIANTASAIIDVEDKTENIVSVSQGPDITSFSGAVAADSIISASIITDGIYDSATQTQIMQLSGTEINFAVSDLTLNGDQIATTTALGNYLLKSGGTMTGGINMGSQEITGASAVRFNTTNVTMGTSSTVGANSTNNINIGNATVMPGLADSNILMGNQASMTGLGTAGNVVMGYLAASNLGGFNVTIGQQATTRGNGIAIGKSAAAGAGATVVGYNSLTSSNVDSVVIGRDNSSGGASADVIGVNRTNNQANSLLLGNGSYVNIRSNNTCDLGTSAAPFQSLYLNGSIAGPTNTRTVDNLVSNAGSSTVGRVATFSSNKVIQDGGTLLSDLATTAAMTTADNLRVLKAGDTMSGSLAMGTFNLTNVGSISGATNTRTADNIISNSGPSVSGNLPTFSGITGKIIADSGTALSALATTSAMTTADNLRLLKAGDTMTGNLAMGANSISGATYTRTADNIAAIPGAQTYGNIAMMSTVTKALEDSGVSSFSVVTGPASAVNNQVALFNGTTGKAIQVGTSAIGTLGALTLANTTASTSTGTGAFICPGGAGINGALHVGGTAKVTGNVSIGTTSSNAQIQLSNSVVSRKIILYEGVAGNDHQFFGLGINSAVMRYQVDGTGSGHVFYAGVDASNSTEIMRATGGGNLLVGTTTASAKLTVAGTAAAGVEDSVIRATSAGLTTRVEIVNTTAVNGRNFELRSTNAGNFDITDRSAGQTRFVILGSRLNYGFGITPIASGDNNVYIANGLGSTFAPANGGILYVDGGNLRYLSQGGKTTTLATNV